MEKCVLELQQLVFDEITFKRLGFKNPKSELAMSLNITIDKENQKIYRVKLTVNGEKQEEYRFKIVLIGFFSIQLHNEEEIKNILSKNAVAIMFPYLRSQISLLTAQPGTESVVLPPININSIF